MTSIGTDTSEWFTRATTRWRDWPIPDLLGLKADTRIRVVIPAHDEAGTIGPIVAGIRRTLLDGTNLIDELVVMDSDSADETARVATESGARVQAAGDVLPQLGRYPGKGEALWKSLFVTTGDVLVFIDADLTEWGPHFVAGLLGPLLAHRHVDLVKGFYDRVMDGDSGGHRPQGGRVTELVARPVLNLFWPELSAVVQPLAGEWAVRRSAIESLPIPVGYGIEMAVLLETWSRCGLDAIAQVDLGERAHRHQSVHDLGVMAAEILHVAGTRLGVSVNPSMPQLWQFDRRAQPPWLSRPVELAVRPPAVSIDGYGRETTDLAGD
jgi:glucosyl-3-phosphoglycerate synthase